MQSICMKKTTGTRRKRNELTDNKKKEGRFTAKGKGYKEEVYHGEQQHNYEKSELSDNNRDNTSGPHS
jgi:hypothetical protein